MLNKVHHVTYVVESISDMAAYMEKSFGIKPISTDEFTEQGFKSILFRIGETLVDFFEPLREDTTMARQLKATGPGVMHVAWGVDGIDAAFKSLQDGGSEMRGDPHFQGKYISFDDISFLPKPVQKPHPPIWVGGESRPALRRTAELADGWYPLGSNPTFPMGTPEQLKAGMERLAGYAERFGRDPSTIETIYRTHQFELLKQAAGPDRLPFVGDADQIAGDIRQYQDMGVTSMIWDFLRQTDDLGSMLGLMEDFSTQVWPKV